MLMWRLSQAYTPTPTVTPNTIKSAPPPKAPRRRTASRQKVSTGDVGEPLWTSKRPRISRRRRARLPRLPTHSTPNPTSAVTQLPALPPILTVREYLLGPSPTPAFTPMRMPTPEHMSDSLVHPGAARRPSRVGKVDFSHSHVKDLSDKCSVYSYNIQMKENAHKKDLQACLNLLSTMRGEGLSPDKYTYSSLLTCCARVNAVDTAIDIYSCMKAEKVHIDNYIRTNLLTVAAKSTPPRIDMCTSVFRTAPKPSRVMCNVLMNAYARLARVEDCLRLCRFMASRSLEADCYTASALVKAYVQGGRLDEAVEKIHEMHASGLEVSAVAFHQVMDAFGKEGKLDEALYLLDSTILYGVKLTQVTYNILISACAHVSQIGRAFELFDEMRATSSFPGDRYTFHSLIKCCLYTGEGHRALDLYREIKKASFPCNQVSYRMALFAAGQVMDLDAVVKIVEDISVHKAVPRKDTAAMMVAAAIRCSDLELALNCFGDYLKRGSPESEVFSFFFETREALRCFEAHGSSEGVDFEYTSTVVDELERSWLRGL